MVDHVDLMLVVGAKNSSNSNRLRDLGEESGVTTYLIESCKDLDSKWFNNVNSVGISSGASTPDELVNEVIDRISTFRKIKIEKRPGIEENVVFQTPERTCQSSIGELKPLKSEENMGIPLIQQIRVGSYIMKQKILRKDKYPLVLMLEPLFRCNLACAGCGKIDYPKEILNQRLSVKDCIDSVEECGAPIVSIPGGEPLIHKEMPEIVRELKRKNLYIYVQMQFLWKKKLKTINLARISHGLFILTASKMNTIKLFVRMGFLIVVFQQLKRQKS